MKFVVAFAERLPAILPSKDINLGDLRTLLQFQLSHIEHLVARIKSQKAEEQLTQEHLAIQSLSQRLLESLGQLYRAYKVAQKQEYALCTFAFASELVTLTNTFLSSTHFDTFGLSVINLIGELSRPSFFVSEVANEYFDILNGLALRCQRLFFGT